jgi:transcriptional antiterminator NusG
VRTDELNETDLTHASDEASSDETPDEAMNPSEVSAGTEPQPEPDDEPQAEIEQASETAEAGTGEPEQVDSNEPDRDVIEAEAAEGTLGVESEDALEEAQSFEPEAETVEPEAAEPEAEAVDPQAEPEETAATDEPAPAAAAAPVEDDPFRGHGDWYVVHTYSGYENKVKANLESRIHTMQMEGKIFGVHIPMEDVMEIKSGKKQVVKKKQFPGYLLVRMIYDNDSWYVVRNTPGVTGFVSAGTGTKPTPLSKHEVEKILAVKKEEVRPQVRLGFEEGDVVRITSGPFADFNGTINEINPDQAKLKVLVNIFDRETPVELSFDQVSKV